MTSSFLMNKTLTNRIPLDPSVIPVSSAYKSLVATRQEIFAFRNYSHLITGCQREGEGYLVESIDGSFVL